MMIGMFIELCRSAHAINRKANSLLFIINKQTYRMGDRTQTNTLRVHISSCIGKAVVWTSATEQQLETKNLTVNTVPNGWMISARLDYFYISRTRYCLLVWNVNVECAFEQNSNERIQSLKCLRSTDRYNQFMSENIMQVGIPIVILVDYIQEGVLKLCNQIINPL